MGVPAADGLTGPRCAGEAAGTPSPLASVSLGGAFASSPALPPAIAVPGPRTQSAPPFQAALFPPTTACGSRDTMISTKEKHKSQKDSMTLLPCFYFVEVRGEGVAPAGAGQRPQSHRDPHAEVQGRPSKDHPRVGAQLECLGGGAVPGGEDRRSRAL